MNIPLGVVLLVVFIVLILGAFAANLWREKKEALFTASMLKDNLDRRERMINRGLSNFNEVFILPIAEEYMKNRYKGRIPKIQFARLCEIVQWCIWMFYLEDPEMEIQILLHRYGISFQYERGGKGSGRTDYEIKADGIKPYKFTFLYRTLVASESEK